MNRDDIWHLAIAGVLVALAWALFLSEWYVPIP